MLRFPDDFLWGTATSSHQVEGNNTNNDWWEWEKVPGHIKDGRRSGLACDWWNRAEEDFERARDMAQNAHRLSLEWSRIEPREGEWSDEAISRYRQMLTALRERGIEPLVTLHHFTNPLWLVEKGGWETEAVIPLFARYVTKVVEELGDLVKLWCTINEPNVYALQGYLVGAWPPEKRSLRLCFKVLRNMVLAHASAYRAIHSLQRDAKVGVAYNMHILDPANPSSPFDKRTAAFQDYLYNRLFLDTIHDGKLRFPLGRGQVVRDAVDSFDYVGLNYYSRSLVAFDIAKPFDFFGRRFVREGAWAGPGMWGEFYPDGLYLLLKRLSTYGKPIFITENGCPDNTDEHRPRFILTHLAAVHHAIEEGIPVKGYFHWTLVDNFEWAEGWGMRFGLIELDVETQERRMKRSGELYKEICKAGAITDEMVERYAPEVKERVFEDTTWRDRPFSRRRDIG
jgi:beta-glucosidase